MSANPKNKLRITAILLLLINGINALTAGYSFITDPSGKGLGITTEYLRYSAFTDFFIPGLILFLANGVLSITIAVITILKIKFYSLFIAFQGAILVSWIIIQMLLLRFFHPLHAIMMVIGGVLIILGWLLRRKEKK